MSSDDDYEYFDIKNGRVAFIPNEPLFPKLERPLFIINNKDNEKSSIFIANKINEGNFGIFYLNENYKFNVDAINWELNIINSNKYIKIKKEIDDSLAGTEYSNIYPSFIYSRNNAIYFEIYSIPGNYIHIADGYYKNGILKIYDIYD